ncbi:hypothetical protein [Stutzerimonas balearica]|uniref:hypothetical protein n=1 Tax=Stutzerimonas balearica TaxID=74829 RepID=UPI0028966095|nr:hypothetical protein [Stutzerimonas balearica]
MRERPILFNGAMVRAILDGRKTVTRRICKPQPSELAHTTSADGNPMGSWWETGKDINRCPYGKPGDRLWVRESWAADAQVDSVPPGELSQGEPICYLADCDVRSTGCAMVTLGKGRPSIHMPRWASRILLEITDVRVERLQAITYEQAAAEGIHRHNRMWSATDEGGFCHKYPEPAFRDLWEITGGDWSANPWVWVVEFKRVEVASVQ